MINFTYDENRSKGYQVLLLCTWPLLGIVIISSTCFDVSRIPFYTFITKWQGQPFQLFSIYEMGCHPHSNQIPRSLLFKCCRYQEFGWVIGHWAMGICSAASHGCLHKWQHCVLISQHDKFRIITPCQWVASAAMQIEPKQEVVDIYLKWGLEDSLVQPIQTITESLNGCRGILNTWRTKPSRVQPTRHGFRQGFLRVSEEMETFLLSFSAAKALFTTTFSPNYLGIQSLISLLFCFQTTVTACNNLLNNV